MLEWTNSNISNVFYEVLVHWTLHWTTVQVLEYLSNDIAFYELLALIQAY